MTQGQQYRRSAMSFSVQPAGSLALPWLSSLRSEGPRSVVPWSLPAPSHTRRTICVFSGWAFRVHDTWDSQSSECLVNIRNRLSLHTLDMFTNSWKMPQPLMVCFLDRPTSCPEQVRCTGRMGHVSQGICLLTFKFSLLTLPHNLIHCLANLLYKLDNCSSKNINLPLTFPKKLPFPLMGASQAYHTKMWKNDWKAKRKEPSAHINSFTSFLTTYLSKTNL